MEFRFSLVAAAFMALFFLTAAGGSEDVPADFSEEDVLYRGALADLKGIYVVANGDVYRELPNGRYTFLAEYYDPEFRTKNYRFRDGTAYKVDPENPDRWFETSRHFADDFENYDTIHDLMVTSEDVTPAAETEGDKTVYRVARLPTRWMELTLQSPRSPEVSDYVALRHAILERRGEFLDNRVDPTADTVHDGERAIRFYSVAPGGGMITAKSSIASNLFHFEKGDDFYFSGWFLFEKGVPTTVMDLESTWLLHRGGIRILLSSDGRPAVELKGAEKPIWRSPDIKIPMNTWVNIRFHTYLHDRDGTVRLWVDNDLALEGSGRTLVLPDTVLDSLEIGISATNVETLLFVDDIVVSHENIVP
jgi:hypothetical protein